MKDESNSPERSVVSYEELRCRLPKCDTSVGQKYLPAPPPGVRLEDLADPITDQLLRNARSSGLVSEPHALGRVQVIHAVILSHGRLYEVAELVRKIEALLAAYRDYVRTCPEALQLAKKLQQSPYSASVGSEDPRFGSLVRYLAQGALNAREVAELLPYRRDLTKAVPLEELRELTTGIEQAASLVLERELASIVSAILDQENSRAAVLRVMGWDGTGVHSVRGVAAEFGCTLRQAYAWRNRVIERLSDGKAFAPTLDRVWNSIKTFVPGPVAPAEDYLLSAQFTENLFDLSGVATAARVLRGSSLFAIKDSLLITPATDRQVRRAIAAARSIVSQRGICRLSDLLGNSRTDVPPKFLMAQITRYPTFAWLDEAAGCFWFTDVVTSNPIVHAIRKIQAVSRTVPIQDFAAAVSKCCCRTPDISASVLLRMCIHFPELTVGTDDVVFGSPGPDSALTRAERVLAGMVSQGATILRSLEFVRRCEAAGVSSRSAWRLLRTSPLALPSGAQGCYRAIGNSHW